MQYRKDRQGREISLLGYGCMRLSRSGAGIDLDKAAAEIRRAAGLGKAVQPVFHRFIVQHEQPSVRYFASTIFFTISTMVSISCTQAYSNTP